MGGSRFLFTSCCPQTPSGPAGSTLKSSADFLETGGNVGNVVLSQCDTKPAALKSIIYPPSVLREARQGGEKIFVS